MASGQVNLIPDGTRVRIPRSGYGPAEVVEHRGPFGPGGVPIYRVLVQTKPRNACIEVRGEQLEVLDAPTTPRQPPAD